MVNGILLEITLNGFNCLIYSIPYFENSTSFVYFSWCPVCLWICYGARSVYFNVPPGRRGTFFFLREQIYTFSSNHRKDLNPCLSLYYYSKVIVELENNTNKGVTPRLCYFKHTNWVYRVCNPTKWHFEILICFDFISCLCNRFLKGSPANNFRHA